MHIYLGEMWGKMGKVWMRKSTVHTIRAAIYILFICRGARGLNWTIENFNRKELLHGDREFAPDNVKTCLNTYNCIMD